MWIYVAYAYLVAAAGVSLCLGISWNVQYVDEFILDAYGWSDRIGWLLGGLIVVPITFLWAAIVGLLWPLLVPVVLDEWSDGTL